MWQLALLLQHLLNVSSPKVFKPVQRSACVTGYVTQQVMEEMITLIWRMGRLVSTLCWLFTLRISYKQSACTGSLVHFLCENLHSFNPSTFIPEGFPRRMWVGDIFCTRVWFMTLRKRSCDISRAPWRQALQSPLTRSKSLISSTQTEAQPLLTF